MRVFVYEFATGGGLWQPPWSLDGAETLIREGGAMRRAIVADFHACGARITCVHDPRVGPCDAPCERVHEISSAGDEEAAVRKLAAEADRTVLIAPEIGGALLHRAQWVTEAGGRLLSPGPEFIRLASDKLQTAERLEAAGIPTPRTRVWHSELPWPGDVGFPAVMKPRDGAGSWEVCQVSSESEARATASSEPRLIQPLIQGIAASVSVLGGPGNLVPLIPAEQRLSPDGHFTYLGGRLPLTSELASRAQSLALAAVRALGPVIGYVGVDLVLGRNAGLDAVIEVNPRLTTSYVGLRRLAVTNLAAAMLDVADRRIPEIRWSKSPIAFDAEGNSWEMETTP